MSNFAATTLEFFPLREERGFGVIDELKFNEDIEQLIVVFKDEETVRDFSLLVQWLAENVDSVGVPTTVRMTANWEHIAEDEILEDFGEWHEDYDSDDSEGSRPLSAELTLFRSHLEAFRRHVTIIG